MRYQLYRSGYFFREWRWRLVAGNNRIIASGEGFKNRQDCLDSIDLVKSAHDAPVQF